MSQKITIALNNPQQAYIDFWRAWEWVKAMMIAGHRMQMVVAPEKRSDAENRLLHAMLGYISKNVVWAGKKRGIDTWKRLLVAAWCRARNEHVEILPAVDGHGVDIVFRRTSTLTRTEAADLIDFIFAWGSQNDLQFPPHPADIGYEEEGMRP